jgi:excisionase family DNA binding protein
MQGNGTSGAQPLLTAQQAAEQLNAPESWVRAEARAGRLPHIRLGARYVRFEATELAAWVASRRQGPTA